MNSIPPPKAASRQPSNTSGTTSPSTHHDNPLFPNQDPTAALPRGFSLGQRTLSIDHIDHFKQVLELISKAAHSSDGHVEAGVLGRREVGDLFKDPRLDPGSEMFDQMVSLKVVRAFAKALGLEWPEMPVVFKDVTVLGDAVTRTDIPTVTDPLRRLAFPFVRAFQFATGINRTFFPPKLPKAKEILHKFTGVIKPGECVLVGVGVIGRPSSGCSTLLRTLANRTTTFKEVQGTIYFAGLSPLDILHRFRGEINFAEENDPHFPSLTVRETLDFALRCRINNALMRQRIMEVTLKLYGLTGCQNTVVGDEIIRGVSGGEKKRVSLAEAACVGGCMGIFDGCTKGLDAASALDFIKGLRNIADFQGRSIVASCYQASDAMFELFDKVIVMADGYCTYFGPIESSVSYFESLGFQKHPRTTKAEFLTTCASSNVISPPDLAKTYTTSFFGQSMETQVNSFLDPIALRKSRRSFVMNLHRFKDITGARKREGDTDIGSAEELEKGGEVDVLQHRHSSHHHHHAGKGKMSSAAFSTSMGRQMVLLLRREYQILRGNPATIRIRTIFNVLMATIVGSVFFQLPKDSSGAFTRGGALFFSLLFNSVSALAELPRIMDGRPVLYKHTESALYRPSTLFLAQIMLSFCVDILLIFAFGVILYFMVGLQVFVGKFFFFYLTLVVSSQSFGLIIKAIGNAVATKEMANLVSGAVLILCVLYNGYMIPQQDMKPWFGWIFYINPLSYGFRSLMINEFTNLSFDCSTSATSIVPFGPGIYNDPAYQTCTLAGAKAGQTTVDGLDYLKKSYDFDPRWLWWNLLVNLGIWMIFLVVNVLIVENVHHGKAGVSVKLYKQAPDVKKPTLKQVVDEEQPPPQPESRNVTSFEMKPCHLITALTWTNVVYKVPHPKRRGVSLELLNNVSGYAFPGTITALMGSSGAGKTTLLDVVARRKTLGIIEGEIMMGSRPQGPDFLKVTGYCEQMDVHNRYATVREALRFAALLRQPRSVSTEEKYQYVEYIIDLLELRKIADALIGDLQSGVGLSMEERKRLTIGVELAARPKILFLDEPTSGLDDQAAFNIVRLLKNLTKGGHALMVTIHQPSATLFSMFDRLLLLGRGGKTIYFGDIGPDCHTLISYFERAGAHACEPQSNPAEYILDCIGAGTSKSSNVIDWFTTWKESPECAREMDIIRHARHLASEYAAAQPKEISDADEALRKDTPSALVKTNLVMKRMFTAFYRSPQYNLGRISFQIVAGLIIGLSFFQTTATPSGAQNRIFALFMTSVLGVVLINLAQPVFISQREYATREVTSGTYHPYSFALAMTTVEIPFALLAATAFFLVFYWTVGLNPDPDRVICFYLTLSAFTLWAVSFGQMVASFAPTLQIASAIVPLCTSILSLFAGVTIPYSSMPVFYRTWLYWVDPYHYFIETLFVNDLHGLKLTCDARSVVQVTAPSSMTCGQYFSAYLTKVPGYLLNPSGMVSCQYCPLSEGDNMFAGFNWESGNRWKNLLILLGFWAFNRVMTFYFVGRFKVKR
ncbi:hypothetical protein HDU67_007582 [Dinochytrium kinnereticum]|nr:hypothetical protein HDU67_007582 [Dinochytrium kinnereticum]